MLNRPDAEEKAADQQTEKMAREVIEEARMVLPGIQALFGFQLMAVFNQRFNELGEAEKLTHFVSALLIALSIGPIMTPAAYHRQVEPGSVSEFFVRLASRLVTITMLPLALACALRSICPDLFECVLKDIE
jgi:MFS-type transporter involved in bile tolerance (Atg22 family)